MKRLAFGLVLILAGCGIFNGDTTGPTGPNRNVHVSELALAAFQESVYGVVRRDCTGCHDAGIGPQFAVSAIEDAYSISRLYSNFDNIPQSRLVIKSQDGHCGGTECQGDGIEMIDALRYWWENGESSVGEVSQLGGIETFEQLLPDALPTGNSFALMQWDLTPQGFPDAIFQVEVQEYNESSYRFRNPRLITGEDPIAVRNVKILINGNYDPRDNAYTVVDVVANPNTNTLLSDVIMLSLKDRGNGDAIVINFQELRPAPQ